LEHGNASSSESRRMSSSAHGDRGSTSVSSPPRPGLSPKRSQKAKSERAISSRLNRILGSSDDLLVPYTSTNAKKPHSRRDLYTVANRSPRPSSRQKVDKSQDIPLPPLSGSSPPSFSNGSRKKSTSQSPMIRLRKEGNSRRMGIAPPSSRPHKPSRSVSPVASLATGQRTISLTNLTGSKGSSRAERDLRKGSSVRGGKSLRLKPSESVKALSRHGSGSSLEDLKEDTSPSSRKLSKSHKGGSNRLALGRHVAGSSSSGRNESQSLRRLQDGKTRTRAKSSLSPTRDVAKGAEEDTRIPRSPRAKRRGLPKIE
jgi:hypothetical protein